MTSRPKVVFLVNGGANSPMGERAQSFASRLAADYDIRQIYRPAGRLRAPLKMLQELRRFRPQVCYVFDMSAAGVMAAGTYRTLTGTPFVVDTGDDIVALGQVLGRGRLAMFATRQLERYSLQNAARIVVRGTGHREVLQARGLDAVVIPDGVDWQQFPPMLQTPLPRPERELTIGLVGSSVWIPARQTCYGSELVEVVRLLRERLPGWNIRGLMIGDGTGIPVLQARCREYGITEHVEFAGRIPYPDLPAWLGRMDIALSTQTNDAVGRVRTTGKLPLYLAASRFILASRVGEAARVLPEEMLVDYSGSVDPEYPQKLVERIVSLVAHQRKLSPCPGNLEIVREEFDYEVLARRLAGVLDEVCGLPAVVREASSVRSVL